MDGELALGALLAKDRHMFFKAKLAEVPVESEGMVEPMVIDGCEAGAIDKAEFFVVVARENRFGDLFDGFGYAENLNPRLIETFDKFDRRIMADLEAVSV